MISSADSPTAKPSDALFILYQSPGIACNAGQETIGSAEKLNPTSTSVSGHFTDVVSAVPTDDSYPYFPNQLEVVLAALEVGEIAIVCCPRYVLDISSCFSDIVTKYTYSGYIPGQGACYSALPASVYSPSVGCHVEPADETYATVNETWVAAGGKTITGQLIRATGTLPFSTITTTFAQSDISSSVGVAIEGMGILIHRSSDLEKAPGPVSAGVTMTGGTTTAPTAAAKSKTGAASVVRSNWNVQGALVAMWCLAFVLGSM